MTNPASGAGDGLVLESRRVVATVPGPSELNTVYEWVNDPVVAYRWRARGAQMTPAQFQDSIAAQVAHFIGRHRGTGQLVAYGTLFAVELRAQHAQLGLLSNPHYVMSGMALELGVCLMRFAFGAYPLRKVYWELPSYNRQLLAQPLEGYATLEAELPEHTFWDGELHSTFMYSIDRDTWFGPARHRWEPLLARSQSATRVSRGRRGSEPAP